MPHLARNQLGIFLVVTVLPLALMPSVIRAARASVITVAPAAATGSSAGCSFTDAVLAANASTDAAAGNVTKGACTPTGTPGGGGDGYSNGNVIKLAAGSYIFTSPNNYWYGPNALPAIASDIVIVGAAQGSVIERSTASGTPALRLFYVGGGESLAGYNAPNVVTGKLPGPGSLTLVNLSIEHGLAHGGNSDNGGGGGMGAGGAIYNQGTLTLEGVNLEYNEAMGGNTGSGSATGGGMGSGNGFALYPFPIPNAATGTFGNGGAGGADCSGACIAGYGLTGGVGGGGGGGGNASGGGFGISSDGGWGGNGGYGGGGGGGGSAGDSSLGVGGNGGDGGFGGGSGSAGPGIQYTGTPGTGGFGGGTGSNYGGQEYGGGGAGFGGAIFNEGGTVMALNSTMSDNTAQAGTGSSISGGVLVAGGNGDSYGGALFNLNGSVTLRYTTLADNRAIVSYSTWGGSPGQAAGGAVYNLYLADPGSPAADTGTAATMTINSSVLASSTDGNDSSISDCVNNDGTFTSGYDVVQNPGTTCTFDNNDQNVAPLFATSAATANGGPTPTVALTRYSPAINSGDTGTTLGPVPTSDQRGYPRDAEPDIGAFEYIPQVTVTPPPPAKTSGGGEFGLTGLASLAAFALLVLVLRRRRPYKR